VAILLLIAFEGANPPHSMAAAVLQVRPDEDLQMAVRTAGPGTTLELLPGTHRGPVTVAQRITVRGVEGTRIQGNGRGSVVTLEADGARLVGLSVAGSGLDLSKDDAGVMVLGDEVHVEGVRVEQSLHGIYVRGGQRARVVGNQVVGLAASGVPPAADHRPATDDGIHHDPPKVRELMGNGIHLWNVRGAMVANNDVSHVRDGIYVAFCKDSSFNGNRIHDARYGIHYMYSSDNAVNDNELWRNVAGAALMFSQRLEVRGNVARDHSGFRAYGILLQDVDTSVFLENDVRGNRVGVRLQHANANEFRANRIFGNLTGIRMGSASRDNVFTRNRISGNIHPIELTGAVPPTHWSVEGVGNQWEAALPLDLTGDGVSEWPHHEVDVMPVGRDEFSPLQLLAGSPGLRLLQWAARRVPVPGMRYVTDPHPLTPRWRDD
jgi:nitrous oxidase accessory protein